MTNGIPPRTNVITSEVTLLPCPFCGGEAELYSTVPTYDSFWSCICRDCGASTSFGGEAEAIAAWNARAEDAEATEMAQRIQSLELECAKMQEELRKAGVSVDVNDVLAILDEIHYEDRISYDDYSRLFDAIAALGVGECEMVTSGTPCEGNTDKRCTACGAYNIGEYYDGLSHIASPKFCPNCGRKVVDA